MNKTCRITEFHRRTLDKSFVYRDRSGMRLGQIVQPLQRVGEKGTGDFRPISWEAALDEVAEAFARSVQAHGEFHVLQVEGVVRKHFLGIIRKISYQIRRHARRRQTICFQAGLLQIGKGRVEVKTDEQDGSDSVRKVNAVAERKSHVIRSSQIDLPALCFEEGSETPCPIERVFFLEVIANDAFGSWIVSAMTGIERDDSLADDDIVDPIQQGLDILLDIQGMDIRFTIY